jgi:flagellar hook-basal body complex protein FliE
MQMMPITTGIVPFESMFDQREPQGAAEASGVAFSEVFSGLLGEVADTNAKVSENAVRMMNGEIDDLHTIYNDMTKAQIAVETFVAVKNAAVNAYQQVTQMQM